MFNHHSNCFHSHSQGVFFDDDEDDSDLDKDKDGENHEGGEVQELSHSKSLD
ncbi:hypothetical protein HanPSC8_Chr05g0205231 [Helianthus annuus]|nr:hypothetical protein HanPSC8_Chr05g0205231 [Helianthus annuus]